MSPMKFVVLGVPQSFLTTLVPCVLWDCRKDDRSVGISHCEMNAFGFF